MENIYKNANLDKINPELALHFKKIVEDKKWKKGIYLHGETGSGKTYAMYAIKKFLEKSEIGSFLPTMIVRSSDIVKAIKNSFIFCDSDDIRFEKIQEDVQFLEDLEDKRVMLVVDDIGSEKVTEATATRFFQIVDARYLSNRPMCFTSNLDLNELDDRGYGERMVSRISECCDIMKITAQSRRV